MRAQQRGLKKRKKTAMTTERLSLLLIQHDIPVNIVDAAVILCLLKNEGVSLSCAVNMAHNLVSSVAYQFG